MREQDKFVRQRERRARAADHSRGQEREHEGRGGDWRESKSERESQRARERGSERESAVRTRALGDRETRVKRIGKGNIFFFIGDRLVPANGAVNSERGACRQGRPTRHLPMSAGWAGAKVAQGLHSIFAVRKAGTHDPRAGRPRCQSGSSGRDAAEAGGMRRGGETD